MPEAQQAESRVGAGTQELRIATAMTGGVSLAIWMGGIARELNLLQQAAWQREARDPDRPQRTKNLSGFDAQVVDFYGKILDLLDLTVDVDILSGTSAGGINAALLGFSHASGLDLGPLRDLWLDAGSLETLLRNPRRGNPSSLLRGDERLFRELRSGLANLRATSAWDLGTAPETRVFITTTLLEAETSRFTDAYGTLVQNADHRGLFEFDENALANEGNDHALALAARCSASFPGAFEPSFISFNDEIPARGDVPKRVPMRDYANITRSHWAADGGLLMNRPIQPLLQAIADRPASRQVRRVLLYVVPLTGDAPDIRESPDDASFDKPKLLSEALLADLGAVLNQSIAAELRQLQEHNERVDALRDTRLRMAELGNRVGIGRLLNDDNLRDYIARQSRWIVRPITVALMREIATRSSRELPANWEAELRPGQNIEQSCRITAADALARRWPTGPPRDWNELAQFGRAPFDGARATVLTVLRTAFVRADAAQRDELADAIERAYEALAAAKRPRAQDIVDAAIDRAVTQPTEPIALADLARDATLRYADELDGNADVLREGWQKLAQIIVDARATLTALADTSEVASGPVSLDRESTEKRARRANAALTTYLAYLFANEDSSDEAAVAQRIALRLFDLHAATRSVLPVGVDEVEQAIDVVQISADTRTSLAIKRSTAHKKLTGVQFHHFGAFYKSSWRANDWMWGRLDGAGWLVHLLLEPRRILVKADDAAPPGGRAAWFYGQLRELVGGDPPELDLDQGDGDGTSGRRLSRDAVLEELRFLDDDSAPIPASLPMTSLWVARPWHRLIAATELPVVAREVVSTPTRRKSSWAREVLEAAGPEALAIAAAQSSAEAATKGEWSKQQRALRAEDAGATLTGGDDPYIDRLASKLESCPVPDEKIGRELGEPLFLRTATQAAAVTTAMTSATIPNPPAVVRPVLTTARTTTLAGYRAASVTRGWPARLLLIGAAALLIGIVASLQGAVLIGLTGLALILLGSYLIALGAWGWVPRLAPAIVAATVIVGVVALTTETVRHWLFGEDKADEGWLERSAFPWLRDSRWHILVPLAVIVVLGGVAGLIVRRLRNKSNK